METTKEELDRRCELILLTEDDEKALYFNKIDGRTYKYDKKDCSFTLREYWR